VFQPLPTRDGSLGQARQPVDQSLALVVDMENIAMARGVPQSGSLSGSQTGPGIGDGIFRLESPGVGVQ
jgi:hypothetical protein